MRNEMQTNTSLPHNIIIEGRKKLSISGVVDVESFDENEIILETSQGIMLVSGEDMRIEKLSIEAGDAVIEGHIISIEYSEKDRRKESFWSKMF